MKDWEPSGETAVTVALVLASAWSAVAAVAALVLVTGYPLAEAARDLWAVARVCTPYVLPF